ncbi:MAG: hypothetical protein WC438_00240 [Candidatus Pacearchaeota archaeon]
MDLGFKRKKFGKGAQSDVISTVLLILLAIVAIGILSAFIVPFIKDRLSSGNCLDYVGKFEIANNPAYTCYNLSGLNNMSLKIDVGDIQNYKGFAVEFDLGATSETFKIYNGTTDPVKMYNGSSSIKLPDNNGAETYLIAVNPKPESISLYIILESGEVCDTADSLEFISDCP